MTDDESTRLHHMNVALTRQLSKSIERNAKMIAALKEAERFLSYFSGETGDFFEGSGTPQGCLKQIRAAISGAED